VVPGNGKRSRGYHPKTTILSFSGAKALAEKQKITAIYAVMGNERVLLSAVAQGDPKK